METQKTTEHSDGRKIHSYIWFEPLDDVDHLSPTIDVRIVTRPDSPPWMYLHALRQAFKEIAVALYEGDPCAPNACTCIPGRPPAGDRG